MRPDLLARVRRSTTPQATALLEDTGLALYGVVVGEVNPQLVVDDVSKAVAQALAAGWNAQLIALDGLDAVHTCQDPACCRPSVVRVYDQADDYRSLCAWHAVDVRHHVRGSRFELTTVDVGS